MNKIYFTAALLLFAKTFSWSQPVINSTDSHNGLSFEMYVAEDLTNLDPGTPGADKTWDFSTIQTTLYGITENVLASAAPHNALFASATHASHHRGTAGEIWSYYKSAPGKYEELGLVYVTIITVNMSADPKTYLELPYTYNKVITDTYRINGGISNTFTSTYDSYGTLKLPFGTFNNVIRQKNVEGTSVNYTYFNTNPVYAICTISENESSITMSKRIGDLAVNDNSSKTVFSVAPNPTSGLLQLQFDAFVNDSISISVSDLMGKTIFSKNENPDKNIFLNLESLEPGIYFIKASDKNSQSSTIKFIKK